MAKSKDHANTDPARPHAVRETNDPGVGAFASGGATASGSQVTMIATTTSSLRATRCTLAGCGRPRQDPIHAAEED